MKPHFALPLTLLIVKLCPTQMSIVPRLEENVAGLAALYPPDTPLRLCTQKQAQLVKSGNHAPPCPAHFQQLNLAPDRCSKSQAGMLRAVTPFASALGASWTLTPSRHISPTAP